MHGTVRQLVVGRRAGTYSAMGTMKQKLRQNVGDYTHLHLGDSVTDANDEYTHLFAEARAREFPAYSVAWHAWDTTDYAAPAAISTGAGVNTLHWYNGSLAGATLSNFMGSLFAAAIGNITPDSITISMGPNYTTLIDPVLRGKFLGEIEQIQLAQPNVPIALVLPPPFRDDNLMDQIVAVWTKIAKDKGDFELIDLHTPVKNGRTAADYLDNSHLNATGHARLAFPALEAHYRRAPAVSRLILPAWMSQQGTNLLSNGDFSDFGGAVPTGHTLQGNGTLTKDGNGKPQLDQAAGNTATSLSQQVSALPGQVVTLAADFNIETSANANTDRLRFITNGAAFPLVALNPGAVGLGGNRKQLIAGYKVPDDATTMGYYIYANSSAGGTSRIHINAVGLFAGDRPYAI